MNYHANQQPLPFVVLNRVYQLGMTCGFCDAVLDNRRGIYANEHGMWCSDSCWLRSAIARAEARVKRGWLRVYAAALIIVATWIVLEVVL